MIRKKRIILFIIVIILIILIGYGYSICSSKEQKDSGERWFSGDGGNNSYIITNRNKIVLLKIEVSCEANESDSKDKVNVKVTNSDLEEIRSFKIKSGDKVTKWAIVNSGDDFYVNIESNKFEGNVKIMNYTYIIF
ncbi:hypothetical protein KQI30_15690 [Clostridium bornimense]|uniref:hypothetical protein n=1 Tax=Clostridium bornimense TaxID=1216932 RepID=UPI001C108833|nr:hypothetical protein [Clostridium bornimense]MBU5317694.1 hypothetical protein [Clostridium bornimense]